ncbi:MAG: PilZ domain-containing protein [Silvanigrellaceae bacterium]|nr:PilZ domain-containing protein [Silvanigrellaceae bacterium]
MAAERVKNFNDEKPFGKISVVIADDQSMKARIMGDYLKISGFIITIANSIDEMRRALDLEKVDVVIMNYHFKNGRGITDIKNAKNKSKNAKVKFIVIASNNDEHAKEISYKNQCDIFLINPFPWAELIHDIKKLSKQEYRKAERMKCHIAFKVTKENQIFESIATDISIDGVFLLDTDKLINPAVGLDIFLECTLPRSKELLKCYGKVVRVTDKGFALQFHNLSDYDKRKIKTGVL